jgi:type IV secretory pathway TrbL component
MLLPITVAFRMVICGLQCKRQLQVCVVLQQAEHATGCAWCLLPAVQIRKIKFRTLGNANNGKHSASAGLDSSSAIAFRGADFRSGSAAAAAAAGCSAADDLYTQ